METILALGTNVMAYCKVCKTMTEHSVVEMKGTKPKRVQCRTCKDTHPYRAAVPTPRKRGSRAAKAKDSAPTGDSYDSRMQGRDPSLATKYDMGLEFVDSDLINHHAFGTGLVIRVLVDSKIEVLFPEGKKLLAHNRKSA